MQIDFKQEASFYNNNKIAMFGGQQEKVALAMNTLDTINELARLRDFVSILPLVQRCPFLRELGQAYDKEGQTIFFKLILVPNQLQALKIMKEIYNQGGHLHRKDNNKQTVIYYAARDEKIQIVKWLIAQDLPLNDNDYCQQTPLFYAAKYNSGTEVGRLLMEAGCEPNHKDANGQTALFYAAGEGRVQMCRLMADYGVNLLATDKNKEKAMHYARRANHRPVLDFLNSFARHDVRKVKEQKRIQESREERRIQESSQNTVQKRRKKEVSRNQYCLVYTNQDGETKVLSAQELQAFRDASENNQKLWLAMTETGEGLETVQPPQRRFQKLALKIVGHFMRHENGHLFNEPVNYAVHGLFDYPSIVKYPMDFGTIKKKLSLNAYEGEAEFQGDMNLVFDNCILYHGTDKDLGKIALQMKTQFNAMFIKQFA